MKKLGMLLVLMSVGLFMTGCGDKETPEPAQPAPEGSGTTDTGSAPEESGDPAPAGEGE